MNPVYGIDLSTKAVSLATAYTTPETLQLDKKTVDAQRLALALGQLTIWFRQRIVKPELVVVEQPVGRNSSPSLDHMTGVVLAALGVTQTCPIITLVPGQWKKLAIGSGKATKPEIMLWARGRGYQGSVQDEADALGIAVAGLQILEREYGEKAA